MSSKVTSKRQVTIPKTIADRYGIEPGDEIEWTEAGEAIRVTLNAPAAASEKELVARRLELFDQATERQRRRRKRPRHPGGDRGWRREELYERGRTR